MKNKWLVVRSGAVINLLRQSKLQRASCRISPNWKRKVTAFPDPDKIEFKN